MNRFFDFEGQAMPARRDEATEFYLEAEDGSVPRKPLTVLLGDGSWAREGAVFSVNRLGELEMYQVVRVEFEIEHHQKRGLYGQLRRRVLVARCNTPSELEASFKRRPS